RSRRRGLGGTLAQDQEEVWSPTCQLLVPLSSVALAGSVRMGVCEACLWPAGVDCALEKGAEVETVRNEWLSISLRQNGISHDPFTITLVAALFTQLTPKKQKHVQEMLSHTDGDGASRMNSDLVDVIIDAALRNIQNEHASHHSSNPPLKSVL